MSLFGVQMSARRYCTNCQKETLHDSCTTDKVENEMNLLERGLLAVVTLGLTELIREPAWKCQNCSLIKKK